MKTETNERRITIRQCAILAGGLGSRLGTLTQRTPKPLLTVGGRPFMGWILWELARFGIEEVVLLTGHLSDRVREAVDALGAQLPKPINIKISEEPFRAGTGGALHHARPLLDDRFLLMNGDSLIDMNFARLFAQSYSDHSDVIGRIIIRPVTDISRYGSVECKDGVVTRFVSRNDSSLPTEPGLINGGIYIFDHRIFHYTRPTCSLEENVLPLLASNGSLRGSIEGGYFIDIGIPADFSRAQLEMPKVFHRPALFLDRDGTVNHDYGWVGTRDRFHFIEGAIETISAATNAGWNVFIVTNQSGIARGLYSEKDLNELHRWLADIVKLHGGNIDDFRYCAFHPHAVISEYRGASPNRKPAPGMINDLIQKWQIARSKSILIGDQETDIMAADAANILGHLFCGSNLKDAVIPLLKRITPLINTDPLH